MTRYRFLLTACLVLCVPTSTWADTYAPQKVVYHINYADESRINATFNNINNHIEALDEDTLDIKVVIHGPSLEYFITATSDTTKQITLDNLKLQDVQFLICGNTIAAYHITRADLYDVAQEDVVQAGLPAIVALQQQGYIYLRP
jgi:hypothetical protein